MTDKVAVDLSGPAQTMLTTLYLKALDADFICPVLGDNFAKDAVRRLEYDWSQVGITGRWAPLVTVRTAQFDAWVRQFLACHETAVVLHVGCGLDSRVFRVAPGPGVQWYDIDLPGVVALRERLFPEPANYHLVPSSATDPSWLGEIRCDRPVLLLAEGMSMYLTESDGVALLRRVVERFPSGELQLDFFNWLAIRSQRAQTLVRRSHSTLHWAVNGPQDILRAVPGTRLLAAVPMFDAEAIGQASAAFRVARRLVPAVPPVRAALQYHRYAFGPVDHSKGTHQIPTGGAMVTNIAQDRSGGRQPRVLLLYYTYTGQSLKVLEAVGDVLRERGCQVSKGGIELTDERYAGRFSRFPMARVWPDMLSVLPAQLRRASGEIRIPAEVFDGDYDLVCFGSPTWWRTTNLPMRSFLKSDAARNLLAGTPFVTFVVCRRYWRDNIRTVRRLAQRHGGRYLGGMHFGYPGGQVRSLLSLTSYLGTGEYRDRYLGMRIPPTNVQPQQLDQAREFTAGIADRLFGKASSIRAVGG